MEDHRDLPPRNSFIFISFYMVDDDPVNFPKHYNKGDIGCIDAIESCQGEGFKYYLQGSILKYMWRYQHKHNPIQDLEKAKWFINKLIETEKEKSHDS